ncbi:MAG TPA: cation-translocating P-type ATPase [Symbiobacteriaceae bacterium]|nr:cation-translocating P-type ATPase [Symbiobacteriaceae bacterium]
MFRHRKLLVVLAAGALAAAAWVLGNPYIMTAAALVAGFPVVHQAWAALRQRQFSIPLLVTVAAVGAVIIGETWEAAAVTLLFVLGSYLEDLTLERTRAALRSLIDLRPRIARVKRGDDVVEVPADAVAAGETVVVRPGDRVPVDGVATAGRAALDTAALTGEPLPAEIGPGDRVLSGSVSQGGYLEVLADRVGPDTTFSRLIYLVAEAQEQKPRVQRFLDRFAQWYTPAVIATAIGLYILTRDVELALTFLVIGCPGALVVAAPVAVVAGLGSAARQGILIKGGERLERIGKVDAVALDKTGTLTQGRPRVTSITAFAGETAENVALLAATAEQRSEHHLATAILTHARELGLTPAPAAEWSLEPGLGATALTAEGEILVGNRRLLENRRVALSQTQEEAIAEAEGRGETIALVALNNRPIGLLGISDPIRPEAGALVAALKRAGVQQTVMLTGDHAAAARRVAASLHLADVRAGQSPIDKVNAVRELQAQGHVVAMIGDGINDAPALGAADVSIAMGGTGTQVAIEAADVALMSDRIEKVPQAIDMSRRIMAVVRQNVFLAVSVVLLLLAGVVTKRVFLSGGMLIHEASVLIVIINGMRLLRQKRTAAA